MRSRVCNKAHAAIVFQLCKPVKTKQRNALNDMKSMCSARLRTGQSIRLVNAINAERPLL